MSRPGRGRLEGDRRGDDARRKLVEAPLRAALAAYDAGARAGDPRANAAAAHFQLGSFLGDIADDDRRPATDAPARAAAALAHLRAAVAGFDAALASGAPQRRRADARARALAAEAAAKLLRTSPHTADPASRLEAVKHLLDARPALAVADAPDLDAALAADLKDATKALLAALGRPARDDDDLASAARARCKAAYLAALKGDPTGVEAHLSPLWTVAPQPTPDA